jgi:hypothetical protein
MTEVVDSSSNGKNADETKNSKIPGIPNYWENFWVSILLHLLLPLFPLAIELIQNGIISKNSLVLAASMYTISIGVSSRSRLMFAFTIATSVFYAFLYGIVSGQSTTTIAEPASIIGILATFIVHAGERYNRHVVDRAPFWEFMSN